MPTVLGPHPLEISFNLSASVTDGRLTSSNNHKKRISKSSSLIVYKNLSERFKHIIEWFKHIIKGFKHKNKTIKLYLSIQHAIFFVREHQREGDRETKGCRLFFLRRERFFVSFSKSLANTIRTCVSKTRLF